MHRRNVLKAGLASGLMGAHLMNCNHTESCDKNAVLNEPIHGFSQIHLLTTQLDELYRFYEKELELKVKKQGKELLITAGFTEIVFESIDAKNGNPFYHFAFNIPENKLPQARSWQKKKTELIKRGKEEIVHFDNWNAHSIFFLDPAGNILEYIARHDLKNSSEREFSSADILYASEVGLVVKNVPEAAKRIRQKLDLEVYKGQSNFFAPLGDEHALLILVKMNRKWTPDKVREAKPYPVSAAIRGLKNRTFSLEDLQYKIETQRTE